MADITIISTKSTYVKNVEGSTNFGSEANIYIGTGTGPSYHYGLIEFDLTTCPEANLIDKALMYINAFDKRGDGVSATIARITASWDEGTVTYNNRPASTGNYGTWVLTSTGAKSVDITDLVKEWKAGTYSNYGIYTNHSATATNYVNCRSDDYATESERPRLIITPKMGSGILAWWFCKDSWEKHDRLWKPKILKPEFEI